jgi:hypothetical protein
MALHEDFMEQDPEKLMGLFRGLGESSDDEQIVSPTILEQYSGLATFSEHAERLFREFGHTDAEAELLSLGATIGLITLARYAQSELPGSEDQYPIV